MPAITTVDLARMRQQLFFEGADLRSRLTRFWTLLVLAGIIATAGVVSDSTATVIGAMIVAPLMTPILGIVLAVVLGDRPNLVRSIALVVLGAVAVVLIGWLVGSIIELPVVAADNSQVAGRVHPRLIDLLAALATGTVGAFALLRSDVSDTLPGVAIAISLVPPLAVVGLTLESGATSEATGALLLFITNVAAILATGIVVMAIFGVYRFGFEQPSFRRVNAVLVIVVLVVVVVVPLAASTKIIATDRRNEQRVTSLADSWAAGADWEVVQVKTDDDGVLVRAIGPLPEPEPDGLRTLMDQAGLSGLDLRVELIPQTRADLPGN